MLHLIYAQKLIALTFKCKIFVHKHHYLQFHLLQSIEYFSPHFSHQAILLKFASMCIQLPQDYRNH